MKIKILTTLIIGIAIGFLASSLTNRLTNANTEAVADVQNPKNSDCLQKSLKNLVGSRINHPDFGSGKIILLEGQDELRVTVEFSKAHHRKFLLQYVESFLN